MKLALLEAQGPALAAIQAAQQAYAASMNAVAKLCRKREQLSDEWMLDLDKLLWFRSAAKDRGTDVAR